MRVFSGIFTFTVLIWMTGTGVSFSEGTAVIDSVSNSPATVYKAQEPQSENKTDPIITGGSIVADDLHRWHRMRDEYSKCPRCADNQKFPGRELPEAE